MSISPRTKFILWTRSGSRCAFPDCRCKLYHEAVDDDPDVLLGEMAHIVGQGGDGPRHDKTIPGAQRLTQGIRCIVAASETLTLRQI